MTVEPVRTPADPLPDGAERLARLQDQVLRLQADQENLLRRAARRQRDAVAGARQDVLFELLPGLDSLDRALLAAGPERDQFTVGVRLVRTQLLEALQRAGLALIPASGQFDPHLHEVLAVVERADAIEGQIVDVVRDGYQFGSVVLRPTQVRVAGPPR